MPTTPINGLRYPQGSDSPNIAAYFQNLATDVDGKLPNPGAWTPYTPTWTVSGSVAPAVGNGTLIGRYMKIGRMVTFHIVLTCGSTTNAGSGAFSFGLPFQAASGREQRVPCSAFTAGPRMWSGVSVIAASQTATAPYLPFSQDNASLSTAQSQDSTLTLGTGVPARAGNYSYVTGDNLHIHGTYEAAS